MKVVTLNDTTTGAGVEFTAEDFEITRNGDMSLCPLITGANWNGGDVLLHVRRPNTTDWYDTGVVLTSAAPGAVVRVRQGFVYRLVPTVPGAALLLSFMIH